MDCPKCVTIKRVDCNILSSFNSFHTVTSPLLLDNTVPDGQYRPLWAFSYDRITQTLLVGHVCITYSKKGLAIISHWLPSTGLESISFRPCSGCSHHVSKYATLSAIKRRCTSERCFLQVQLTDTVTYPTKNAKVFATGRPIKLSTSLSYTSSLAMVYFNFPLSNTIITPSSLDVSDDIIPSTLTYSACNLYTDGSFLASTFGNSPSMSFAWLALDEDNLILEFSLDVIPLTYPFALRSETFASCQRLRL
ncbi:hypothetical protein RhiirC2_799791 [Rhizophagus irregularis]|uniref:Uncharacterized protein n=1 Tax=Rhizophagus irregularis TaxID=588596 RepID=A0A2N1M4G7_9GLOM|nr:hypothetical protein RhiirC2_799791 [Rhizophagus irregularis]